MPFTCMSCMIPTTPPPADAPSWAFKLFYAILVGKSLMIIIRLVQMASAIKAYRQRRREEKVMLDTEKGLAGDQLVDVGEGATGGAGDVEVLNEKGGLDDLKEVMF